MSIDLDVSKRRLVGALGSLPLLAAASPLALAATAARAADKVRGQVLVVGAGYGGATAASYLRRWGGPDLKVTLIEREAAFVSCPLSNLVLGGSRTIDSLTVGYDGLRALGVEVLRDEVTEIDASGRKAKLAKGGERSFDRIVVSPGVDLNFAAVQGLDETAQQTILHAWKAGPQTLALRKQLEEMRDGGVYVLTIPMAPYRCPPGPYERVCQIAHYFKTAKPSSKIIVLDANPDITSKKGLFLREWEGQYKGMIDYQPNMRVTEVDAKTKTAVTELGDRVQGDVLNIVPPQSAAQIAHRAGLVNANDKWCMVDWITLESTAAPGVHVLGDATLAAPTMPKSGHMANQHGKAAAAAIIELLAGRTPKPVTMANTCYSFVDDKRVIHVASVHRYVPEKKMIEPVGGAGGVSVEASELEGEYANAWARNIWADMLG